MLVNKQIVIIGAGSMAEALLKGMLAKGLSSDRIAVVGRVDSERTHFLEQCYQIAAKRETALFRLQKADIVLLAVKPKDMQEALTDYRRFLPKQCLFISILAGVPIRQLRAVLPTGMPVIRAMPNTSVRIGMGVTAIAAAPGITENHWSLAEALFATVGSVERVREAMMDSITAVSGSGPAYVYLFAEAMEQAAIAAGLEPDLAGRLTQQTIIGAAHMLQNSQQQPAELRRQVTSPQGTTQAALDVLESGKFVELMEQAIRAATRRSRELSAVSREAAATD